MIRGPAGSEFVELSCGYAQICVEEFIMSARSGKRTIKVDLHGGAFVRSSVRRRCTWCPRLPLSEHCARWRCRYLSLLLCTLERGAWRSFMRACLRARARASLLTKLANNA